MSFVIFDTEYTTWEGCLKNGWHGNQKREIVQMAALKVSENLDVISEFNQLCRPQFNPEVSAYFTDLTRITNDMIRLKGRPFKDVLHDFLQFIGTDICLSHSWGSPYENQADGFIIGENLKMYHLPEISIPFRNIAALFRKFYDQHHIDVVSQSSGQIAKILNRADRLSSLGIQEHNALYDVYSILEGIRCFKSDFQKEFNLAERSIL